MSAMVARNARRHTEFLRMVVRLFDRHERMSAIGLLAMMVVGAGLEVLGIGAVTAFVAVMTDPARFDGSTVHGMLTWLKIPSTGGHPVLWLGTIVVAVFGLKNLYLAYLAYRQVRFAFDKEVRLSRALLASYLDRPYAFFLQRNSSALMRNVTHEVSHVVTGVILPGLTLLSEVVVLFFVMSMLVSVEPAAAIATGVLLGGTSMVFVQSVRPVLSRHGRVRSSMAEARIRWVNQSIGSVKELKLLQCAEQFVAAFHDSSRRYARAGVVASTLNGLPRPLIETVAVMALMAVLMIGAQNGDGFEAMLPSITLFALAAMRVMPSINRIAPAVNQIRFWAPSVETVYEDLLGAGMPARRFDAVENIPNEKLMRQSLSCRGLGFRYEGAQQWALRDVTLHVKRGSSVGFMGASGAGKSTLVDLLLGLLDPVEGEIRIDDRPLSEQLAAWRRHVGFVPQVIYLMDDTVRRNVALGIPDDQIDEERVLQVLRQARLEEVVRRMPEGLDTRVGDRGIRLSGGERQRLGIARALYRDPEVVVFDEATSALDGETEREISETIRILARDRTLLLVAHRVTTVRECDVVYFLQNGRVVDAGTFDGLMASNDDFRRMVDHDTRPVVSS